MSEAKHMTVADQEEKRENLRDILPLENPLSVRINIYNLCNFKCFYCHPNVQALVHLGKYKWYGQKMDFVLYKRCIDSLAQSGHLKSLILTSEGEPLLHPEISKFVCYAKEKNVADRIDIVTNASVLTRDLSDKLIDAGLDQLRISLQGLNSEQYLENCKIKVDFTKFIDEIRYFYTHKKHTNVYVKIMDVMVPDSASRAKFYEMFEDIADELAIEHLHPVNAIDLSEQSEGIPKLGQHENSSICSPIFCSCTIEADGSVFPCCSLPYPLNMGNIATKSFREIWNGMELYKLQVLHLTGKRAQNPICNECKLLNAIMTKKDVIDDVAPQILEKIIATHEECK